MLIQEVFGGMRKGIKEILKGEEGRGTLRTMMVLMLNRGWDGVVGCLCTINCIISYNLLLHGLETEPGFISEEAYIWKKETISKL